MKKVIKIFAAAVIIMASISTNAFASSTYSDCWKQTASGEWYVQKPNGVKLTNAWFCDDAVAANGKNIWYLLDETGLMISAGLIQDGTGNYYSIETNHNGYYGMLRYKSGTYDGVYLEIEQSHNGSFGAVKNADGIAALKTKYGVKNVSHINNSNIVYSSQLGLGNAGNTNSSDVVQKFVAAYIKPGMTDLQKEIVIVQYLVENINYDVGAYMTSTVSITNNFGKKALETGNAVCSGYAEAFKLLADASGLQSEVVTGKGYSNLGSGDHAWNQVCIDGKWYNLDVTWEDPLKVSASSSYGYTTENGLGFNKLRNQYINLTDDEFRKTHSWNGGHICTSTENGPDAVRAVLGNKAVYVPSVIGENGESSIFEITKHLFEKKGIPFIPFVIPIVF